jgi:hypothetical protein
MPEAMSKAPRLLGLEQGVNIEAVCAYTVDVAVAQLQVDAGPAWMSIDAWIRDSEPTSRPAATCHGRDAVVDARRFLPSSHTELHLIADAHQRGSTTERN